MGLGKCLRDKEDSQRQKERREYKNGKASSCGYHNDKVSGRQCWHGREGNDDRVRINQ